MASLPSRFGWFALTLFAAPLPALGQEVGRTIYCCEDVSGRPACGDMLPPACYGRAYREISPQGTVRKNVAAPLTALEIARRDAEEKRRKEEQERLLKQRRIDLALLETYTSLEDIDVRQDRAIAEVERTLEPVLAREAELLELRSQHDEEAAAYRGRELPRDLGDAQRNVSIELAALRSVIDAKQREIEAIRARFAVDRRRYAELIAAGEERR